jgi:hypothetical protein
MGEILQQEYDMLSVYTDTMFTEFITLGSSVTIKQEMRLTMGVYSLI